MGFADVDYRDRPVMVGFTYIAREGAAPAELVRRQLGRSLALPLLVLLRNSGKSFLVMILLCLGVEAAHAHTPDTSYASVEFTPSTLRLEFRYDLESLTRLVKIDANSDGLILESEFRAVESELRRFLRKQVEFEINEHPTDFGEFEPARWPKGEGSIPLADWNQTIVAFPFERKVREIPESVTLIFNIFEKLGDRHKVLGVFKQPDKPAYEVIYTFFEPDFLYFTNYAPSWWSQLGTFVWFGVEHIFIGYDHILFLLALMIGSKFWEVVKIVSAFTLAHTITLFLAATEIVTVPSRLVEICIAATIVYVAIENLLREESLHRWRITFLFGLIHGFGFANVLRELGLPREGLVRCLLAFNVGVELGQLVIVACLWPLWRVASNTKRGPLASRCLSGIILACGSAWLIDRFFGLEWMPF
jgi:hydrogenase/urease accessory protein HupE